MNSGNNKIKVGVIGFGRMGITHYSIINSHPRVDIKGVVDPSPFFNQIFSKNMPLVAIYKEYKEIFQNIPLDAILICTPPNLNYSIIKLAHELGIHVFVEKPFCTNIDEARELVQLYEARKLINQVGYVNRFNDVFCKVKEFVEKDVIGEVIRFKSEMFSSTITQNEDGSNWRMSRESGGGVVYEMASHAIDLVCYIIGKPDKVIGSSLTKIYSKKVEDAVSTTLLYKNGISGTIYVNWSDDSYRKPTNKLEIFGTKGKILTDQHSLKIFLKRANESFHLREGWNTLYITDIFKPVPFYVRGNEFTRQLYHFADSILVGSIPQMCTFKDGLETLNIIDQIFTDCEINQVQ